LQELGHEWLGPSCSAISPVSAVFAAAPAIEAQTDAVGGISA
jgi:hypothetical protein